MGRFHELRGRLSTFGEEYPGDAPPVFFDKNTGKPVIPGASGSAFPINGIDHSAVPWTVTFSGTATGASFLGIFVGYTDNGVQRYATEKIPVAPPMTAADVGEAARTFFSGKYPNLTVGGTGADVEFSSDNGAIDVLDVTGMALQ